MSFRPPIRQVASVAILLAALLGATRASLAQSPEDGFSPVLFGVVRAIALQTDGRILVGGDFTTPSDLTTPSHIARLNRDGSLDSSFVAGANGTVRAIVVQPDGRILVGGDFTTLGGGGSGTTARNRLGRLNADGSLDHSFDPNANGPVHALALASDGRILVGGAFTSLANTPRQRLGWLHGNGLLDITSDPAVNGTVHALAIEPDGDILVGGAFTTITTATAGPTWALNIARLQAGGQIGAFYSHFNAAVHALVLQPDGRMLVGGDFTTTQASVSSATTPRHRIARLEATGFPDESFDPGADGPVYAIAIQRDGRIMLGGAFAMLGGGTGTTAQAHFGRLNPDATIDPTFQTNANDSVFALVAEPAGTAVAGGAFTQMRGGGGANLALRSYIGRVAADGSLDANFDPGSECCVEAIAIQPDGRILIAGSFTRVGGTPFTDLRSRIARLNQDGSVDPTFNPGANGLVRRLIVQADGKILLAGQFTGLGGGTGATERRYIGRLNPDGSVDPDFNPSANGEVTAMAVQADGKIIIGGGFTALACCGPGTTARNRVARVHADGTLDAGYDPGADGTILAITLEPDGRALMGGHFSKIGNGATTPRSHLARLGTDGAVDLTFDPGANGGVEVIALQADGRILVAGGFNFLGGGGTGLIPRSRLGRLNVDGSLDFDFDPGVGLGSPAAIVLQDDGRIVLGGGFLQLGGGGTGTTTRVHIGRLHADGSLDVDFNPGANSGVQALAVQADGKLLVGGAFFFIGDGWFGGSHRGGLARLTNTDAAAEDVRFSSNGTTATWRYGGAAPAVQKVTFESCTSGGACTPLGNAARVAGGWQLAGLDPPAAQNLLIRARGYAHPADGAAPLVEVIQQVYLFRQPPIPFGATFFVPQNVAITGQLRARDPDGDPLTFTLLSAPTKGTMVITDAASGAFTYTPGMGALDQDPFSFQVSDGVTAVEHSGSFSIFANDTPAIAIVPNLTIDEDTAPAGGVPFTVDDEVPATVTISATSSDPILLPPSAIAISGTGASRTMALAPAANRHGVTTITVTATDQHGFTGASVLTLTVQSVNDVPTASAIGDQTARPGSPTAAIVFTVGDVETAASSLAVTAASSNPAVVPQSGIVLGGAGANRNVTVTPDAAQAGTASITITVTDADGGSAATSFTVTVEQPAPTALAGTADGSLVQLAWTAPASGPAVTGYLVEAGASPGTTMATVTTNSTAPSFTMNLPAAGTWFVRVRSQTALGPSSASNEVALTTFAAPSRPRDLAFTLAGSTVTFSWGASSSGGVVEYVIEAGSAPGGADLAQAPTGSPVPGFTASSVPAGTYYVRVRARGVTGQSAASNDVVVVLPPSPLVPGSPGNLAVNVAGNFVSLSWQAPSGALVDTYVLEAGTSPGSADVLSAPIGVATTLVQNGVPSGTYYVRVRARNAYGMSGPSNEVAAVVGGPVVPPGAPMGLVFATGPGGVVTLGWAAPTTGGAVTGYIIDAGSAPGVSDLASVAIGPATVFSTTGVPPGTYHVRVRAVNAGGSSPASNEVIVVVP